MRRGYRKPYRRSGWRSSVPRKKTTTRGYVRNNAIVNRRQDRHISRLYKLRYGPVQRNLQLNNTPIVINASQPIAFDASDFSCQRTATGGQTSPGCIIWQTNNLLLQITQASGFIVDGSNALWAPSNSDLPDGGRYKPLYAEYQVQISGNNNVDDAYVQLDLFTQHHGFQSWQLAGAGQSVNQRIMPYALTNLGRMITSNELNPSLFKRYKRIRVLLNSQTNLVSDAQGGQTGFTATTANTKYFKFRVAPKRPRNQVFSSPDTPGEVDDPNQQTGLGPYGIYQVDPRTPFWCLISTTDRTALDGDSVRVDIKRHVVWRDINGGTKL